MGFIDHEVGLSRLIDGQRRQSAEGRTRGKDVIVVADDDVGFPGPVQLQLERADFVFFSQLAEGAGLELLLFRENIQDPVIRDFRVIIAGVFAEVGTAERFVLEADLAFCRNGEGLESSLRPPESA